VSPIWDTPGAGTVKPAPRGVEALVRARHALDALPSVPPMLYALGGVDGSRAASCARAGADGVAVIRALLDAADPALLEQEARLLARAFDADPPSRGRLVCVGHEGGTQRP
jgi:thiamine monophosphate synthase